jgi:hypothetical protein
MLSSKSSIYRMAIWLLLFILGVVCLYFEFLDIKKENPLPFAVIFDIAILVFFVIGTGFQIVKDILYYKIKNVLSSFLPSVSLIIILISIFIHRYLYSDEVFGTTKFTAYNDHINHGVLLDFKTNGNLKIVSYYKFGETQSWGKYSQSADTLILNIETDFKLGRKALLKNDTLYFIDDTVCFVMTYP